MQDDIILASMFSSHDAAGFNGATEASFSSPGEPRPPGRNVWIRTSPKVSILSGYCQKVGMVSRLVVAVQGSISRHCNQECMLTGSSRYFAQIRYGCDQPECTTPSCFGCQKRVSGVPVRRPTAITARAQAYYLASQDNPEAGLCPYVKAVDRILNDHDLSLPGTDARHHPKKDRKSLIQNLFDTALTRGMASAVSLPSPNISSGRPPLANLGADGSGERDFPSQTIKEPTPTLVSAKPYCSEPQQGAFAYANHMEYHRASPSTPIVHGSVSQPNGHGPNGPRVASRQGQNYNSIKPKGGVEQGSSQATKQETSATSMEPVTILPEISSPNGYVREKKGDISTNAGNRVSEASGCLGNVSALETPIQSSPDSSSIPNVTKLDVSNGLNNGRIGCSVPNTHPPHNAYLDCATLLAIRHTIQADEKLGLQFLQRRLLSASLDDKKASVGNSMQGERKRGLYSGLRPRGCKSSITMSLSERVFATLSDVDGLTKSFREDSCYRGTGSPLSHLDPFRLQPAFRHWKVTCGSLIYDGLWHGIEALFNPPPDLTPTRSTGPKGLRQNGSLKSASNRNGGSPSLTGQLGSIPEHGTRSSGQHLYVADPDAAHISMIVIHALVSLVPILKSSDWTAVQTLRAAGKTYPNPKNRSFQKISEESWLSVIDELEYEPALRLASRLIRALAARRCFWEIQRATSARHATNQKSGFPLTELLANHLRDVETQRQLQITERQTNRPKESSYRDQDRNRAFNPAATLMGPEQVPEIPLAAVLVEWLRTPIIKEWDGKAEVKRWGPVGGAIELLNDLCTWLAQSEQDGANII